jgi:hypothetical protein
MEKKLPCIHNNGSMRLKLRDDLYSIVYERGNFRLRERLDEIIKKNVLYTRQPYEAFTYKGEFHSIGVLDPKAKPSATYEIKRQFLHDSLRPAMDLWLADRNKVQEMEGPLVQAAISSVLASTKHVDSYMQLLPPFLHSRLREEQDRCSCVVEPISDDRKAELIRKYGKYINLIRERQVLYLLDPP